MKKVIFCVTLALAGLMTACVEKNEAVDADSKPSWLGESIYQELKNPQNLTGTFSTYLQLIDDLGYAEILNRTGSKTVFPANDEAFQRFFQSNDWGVKSYSQLSTAQKKMLLYSSMLDNALLVGMMSNVSNTSSTEATVSKGVAMKHQTNLNVIDTIQHLTNAALLPQNNKYWDKYRDNANMYVVSDATRPMMVHFTREHMLNNGITTLGDKSDFSILTGTPYSEGMAYIFGDQIVKSDVTCQNGYIHQMLDVIVPPGNMAQVLRSDEETGMFSRILDYFSAPFENDAVTNTYNAWAQENGKPTVDKVYEIRYLNNKGSHRQNIDPDGNLVPGSQLLAFDPGWNQYSPSGMSGGVDYTIADVAAMFVPTNAAMEKFFCQGGDGAYLIDLYGKYPFAENTPANLAANLDQLHQKMPGILTAFINNLMKSSFTASVPSKFADVKNDASEYMGVTLDKIDRKANGAYDILFANNGVIYKMTELIAPDEYQSVLAPASVYPDMKVFGWAADKDPSYENKGTDDSKLNIGFKYYLMSMSSNFGFFIPDSTAFDNYYIDPAFLGHDTPRALRFYHDGKTVRCVAYQYDKNTNTVGEPMNGGAFVEFPQWKTQMIDLLNYHTVVLEAGDSIGTNRYYKTKHGGEIYVTGGIEGAMVMSGQQIDNGLTPATVTKAYKEKNGKAYRIDHVIQAPSNSVSKTLQSDSRFSEFYQLCFGFGDSELLEWAGISREENEFHITEQDSYTVFTTSYKNGNTTVSDACLDENVKMFNTYNYTLYAPNNAAMQKAYANGLPTWDQVNKLFTTYADAGGTVEAEKKLEAKEMINKMRTFARYHFQSTSIYADNVVATNRYNSLSTDAMGLARELRVRGGNGQLIVTDGAGVEHVIDANDASKKCNLMTRDYWFDRKRTEATSIYTSSFCVIHEITEPLDPGQN